MIGGKIAKRYAKALLAICEAQAVEAPITRDLASLDEVLAKNAELRALLTNPSIETERRDVSLTAILDGLGVHPLARNFFRLLLRNGRIAHVGAIRSELTRLLDVRAGRVRADVATATPIDPMSRQKLQKALEKLFGKQVVVEPRVDPAVLAGAVTRVGHVVFDGSLRTYLERMRQHLVTQH